MSSTGSWLLKHTKVHTTAGRWAPEVRDHDLSSLPFLLTPCCQSSQGGSNKAHLAPAHQDHSPVLCPFSLLFQSSKSSNVVLPPILLAASPPQQLLNLSKDLSLRWETQSRGQQLSQTGLREAVHDQPATNCSAEARWPGNISSLPVKQGVCIPQGRGTCCLLPSSNTEEHLGSVQRHREGQGAEQSIH